MYQVLKFELENDTIPAHVKNNAGCEIDGVYIGIGEAQTDTFIFDTADDLVAYLQTHEYGTGWGPRADGTTPTFDALDYATNVFARCAKYNDEL